MNFTLTGLVSAKAGRLSSLRTGSAVAAAATAALGALVLGGWQLRILALTNVLPHWAPMKPNTALGFLFAGLALWWLRTAPPGGRRHGAGLMCAGGVALLGLLNLTQWLGGWDFGFDNLLFSEAPGADGGPSSLRMSPATAFCFLLAGLALSTLNIGGRAGRRPTEMLVFPLLAVAYVALLGYLYGVESLHAVAPYACVAVHTAAGFLVLGVGVLCARPDRGWMALVAGDTAGGDLIRRLLPTVLLIMPVLGWLGRAGEHAGWYSGPFGLALVVLASGLVLTVVVWRSAHSLDSAECRRQRAEGARAEGERHYRVLTEVSPQFVWISDAVGTCTYVNQCWVDYSGLTAEQSGGLGWTQVIDPDHRPAITQAWRQAAASGTWNEEIPFRRAADGHYRWHLSRAVALRDDRGQILQWIGTAIDIHDRKLAEELNRKTLQALPAHIAVLDRQGRIVAVNQAWMDFATANGAEGSPTVAVGADYLAVYRRAGVADDPDIARTLVEIEGVLNGTLPRCVMEYPCHSPSQQRWFVLTAVPLGPDGGAVVTHLSITERKLAELALREADRRKDEFLATLAHELRNPLAPIRNAVEILNFTHAPAADLQAARDMIARQVGHMVRLIDDLMDVSRISRGKLELRRERVALAAVMEQAVDTSRPHIESARHRLVLSLPPFPILLDADPVRLAQVFSNLLNNAAKYTAPAGTITVTAAREGAQVIVRVTDTGIGIPPENVPGLFDMFSQVGAFPDRSQGGLGIGLALARSLVELHGGQLEVQSEGRDMGSTFSVRLPVIAEATADPTAPTGRGYDHGDQARRILVVDDNRDSADSLAMLLRLAGHAVETAYDGVEAVAAAQHYHPDVILLDLGMPKLDGHDACRRIRAFPWGSTIAIYAVTGRGQEQDRNDSRAAGFDGHLVKPVEAATLLDLLDPVRSGPRPCTSVDHFPEIT